MSKEIKENKDPSAFRPLTINRESPSEGSVVGIIVPSMVRVGKAKSGYGRTKTDPTSLREVPDTSPFTKEGVRNELVRKLHDEGLRVHFPEDAIDPPIDGLTWANSVEERTRQIVNMLNNPKVDAIWAFSGGESAIEVAAMLDAYDRNPDKVEAQIKQAYRDRYKKEPPEDFFGPRLTGIPESEFYNPARGLPKRGIPFLGFSDVSNLHIVLGQKGVVSSFYANNAEHIMDTPILGNAMDLRDAIQYLTSENPSTTYNGLASLGDPVTKDVSGKIFSINGAAFSSTIGTGFGLSFREPTILALEFAGQDVPIVGDILLKALESGTLRNVSGIALGRVGDTNLDMVKFREGGYPKLTEFVEKAKKAGIPVFAAQSPEREHTWGHGGIVSGSIVKPFANYAEATITVAGSLAVRGSRSLEDIDASYAAGIRDRVAIGTSYEDKEHKSVAIDFTQVETVQKVKGVDLSNVPFLATDIATLRGTNGTVHQITSKDKVFVLSCSQLDPVVHSTLVESQLVGALNGAKAIVIALPEGKCKEVEGFTRESLPKVLQDFSKRHLGGKVPILIAHNNELARGLVRGNISINLEKGLAVSPEIQEEMQKSFSKSDKFTSEHKDMESKESWVQKMVSRTPGGSMEV